MVSNYDLKRIHQALWQLDLVNDYFKRMYQSKFNRKWKIVKQDIQTELIDNTWLITGYEGMQLKNGSDVLELLYSEKKKWYLRTSPSKTAFLRNMEYQGLYKLWEECCNDLNHK